MARVHRSSPALASRPRWPTSNTGPAPASVRTRCRASRSARLGGGGETSGSLDVVSLGNGGVIVLGLGDQVLEDGDGPDFIVFENAFYAGGDPEAPFAELATVEVSEDGETWAAFACEATEAPYGSCAGWRPVLAGAEGSSASPHDPREAGGDPFDLADVGLARARFIRITDRPDLTGLSGSFDLDAVALVHWTCAP
jgi:hypothetical protein